MPPLAATLLHHSSPCPSNVPRVLFTSHPQVWTNPGTGLKQSYTAIFNDRNDILVINQLVRGPNSKLPPSG